MTTDSAPSDSSPSRETSYGAKDSALPLWMGMGITALAAALVFLVVLEWGVYVDPLGGRPSSAGDRLLLAWAILAKTLLVLAPIWMVASLVSWRRPAAGRYVWQIGGALALAYLAVDLRLYQLMYRHLVGFFQFAGEEAVQEFTASAWVWLAPLLVTGIVTALLWLLLVQVVVSLVARLRRRAPRPASWLVRSGLVITALLILLAPMGFMDVADQPLLVRRLLAALPLDPALVRDPLERPDYARPQLNPLHEELESTWQRHLPGVKTVEPVDRDHASLSRADQPLPDVLILVVESLQHDVLTKGWMPRLSEWSKGGMRLGRHFSGGQLTEEGMFALCYGRSPLLYHETLDAGVPPQLVESFRREGYQTTFLSAHHQDWLRMECFLDRPPFDCAVHFDGADWPANDRLVGERIDRILTEAESPQLIVAFFMSTHFEYRYPPEYAHHQPTEDRGNWLGRDKFIDTVPMGNCYRNSLLFTDDLLADLLARHDGRPMITLLTSDQGESLGEDGGIGHGERTSDIRLRVPMVLRGPGVPVQEVQRPTDHMDLLPTLAGLLAGRPVKIRGASGVDLVHHRERRTGVVVGMRKGEDAWLLLARGDDRLRLQVSLSSPRLVVEGFEDGFGRLLATPPASAANPGEWARLLEGFFGGEPGEFQAARGLPPPPR